MDKIITTKELAKLLKLHPASIRPKAASGEIPGAFRVGRDWRFDWEAVRVWLERGGGK